MAITKEGFRGIALKTHKVEAPELGGDGHVYVRKLSLKGREDYEAWCDYAKQHGVSETLKNLGFRGYLLTRVLCDEHGNLIFDDPAEGTAILNECPADVMDRLHDEAVAFNNLIPEAQEALEGNSQSGPSADSL